jgi:hypothetical protein
MRLQGTTESLELVTSSVAPIDVLIDWSESEIVASDISKAQTFSDEFAITTANTFTLVAAAAAAGLRRDITRINIRNKSNSLANQLTLQKDVSATNFEYFKVTIGVGETLQYTPVSGWSVIDASGMVRAMQVATAPVSGRPLEIFKIGATPEAVGTYYLMAKDSGFPGAWTINAPGMAGRTCDGTTAADAGALPIPNAATGANFLTGFQVGQLNVVGTPRLLDCLWFNSGAVVTTITAQTVGSVALPARDNNGSINGEGCMIGVYVSAATTNAAAIANMTITYTNSAGVAGRVATMAAFPATCAAGTLALFQLQAGDVGVRAVTDWTLGTSLLTGTVHLMVVRMLPSSPVLTANTAGLAAGVGPKGVRLYNGSCLFAAILCGAAGAATLYANGSVSEL